MITILLVATVVIDVVFVNHALRRLESLEAVVKNLKDGK